MVQDNPIDPPRAKSGLGLHGLVRGAWNPLIDLQGARSGLRVIGQVTDKGENPCQTQGRPSQYLQDLIVYTPSEN